jgi:hypothetical protein
MLCIAVVLSWMPTWVNTALNCSRYGRVSNVLSTSSAEALAISNGFVNGCCAWSASDGERPSRKNPPEVLPVLSVWKVGVNDA